MTTINPWINFNGNAKEAFDFYKSVFGGELTKIIMLKDVMGEANVPAEDANKYLRIVLPIGPGSELIGNDVPSAMGKVNEMENRSKISVSSETKEEAERIFNGLSQDGQVEMPLSEGPFGGYFAMFRDKFGIEWTIETENK